MSTTPPNTPMETIELLPVRTANPFKVGDQVVSDDTRQCTSVIDYVKGEFIGIRTILINGEGRYYTSSQLIPVHFSSQKLREKPLDFTRVDISRS